MEKKSNIKVGLTGNPNVGKSTLFNALTKSKQHVGNWPGKTVEKKDGYLNYNGTKIQFVDLPGSYSLTAYTQEEAITTTFVLEETPDVVVQIVDAQNLERNLFMTIQLIEMSAPLVLAVNLDDLARKEGRVVDTKKLSLLLNTPVVVIDARHKKGIDTLIEAIIKKSGNKNKSKIKLTYGAEVNEKVQKIRNFIAKNDKQMRENELDWITIKLLEGDIRVDQKLIKKTYYIELKSLTEKSVSHLETVFGKDIHNILANTRYGFIKGLSTQVIKCRKNSGKRNFAQTVDCLLTNKFLGIPIFLIVAWLMFQSTFTLSEPLMGLMESLFIYIGNHISVVLESIQSPYWINSLVIDGIIGGVGGILTFIPIIGILFLIIAILEDSGYMARVAYVMDKSMQKIGLQGKAFIPMMLGFGCNVPGIMATRALETKSDRLLTILINPFMSCGARLPVYVLFTGAFFSAYQGWIIFSLYILGVLIAIIMGFVFRKILSKKSLSPFVIELPPYRWPSITGLLIHVWEKIWLFIKKAGTVILAFSIIIWALASFPAGVDYGTRESFAGQIGETIAPVFKPLGFGNWQSSVALISGFTAKEVIISTFGTIYNAEEGSSLEVALKNNFTPLSAYSFMVFILLYVPCVAVLAVVKRETNSWKWPIFMVFYTTLIAWTMSFIVYRGGILFGFV
ncbi:ferrous iron transport protein B [bacterium]|nr:ferrous iron transport protein B [bacterium]